MLALTNWERAMTVPRSLSLLAGILLRVGGLVEGAGM